MLKLTACLLGSTWICLSAYGVKTQPNMPQNTWSFKPSSTPLPPPPQNTFGSMLSGTPLQSNTWTSYMPPPPQSTFSAVPVQSSVCGSSIPPPPLLQNTFSATPVYLSALNSVATPPAYSQGVALVSLQNVGHFVPSQRKTSNEELGPRSRLRKL